MSPAAEIVLPELVVEYIRGAFASANQRTSAKVSRMPTTHETSLDHSLIEALSLYAAPQRLDGDWIVRLRTHYLGGGRHFGEWEIADVGIILVVRERGVVRTRKVALLQSKRLYPDEQNFEEDVPLDYMIGFGGLMVDDAEDFDALADRPFSFGADSRYKAMPVGDEQWKRIQEFETTSLVPVHYLLYHPLTVPWRQIIPVAAGPQKFDHEGDVGAKVLRARDLRTAFESKSNGKTHFPSFAELSTLTQWPIDDFVADELLGCREGYLAARRDDPALAAVFSRRTGPIAASLSITIDRV